MTEHSWKEKDDVAPTKIYWREKFILRKLTSLLELSQNNNDIGVTFSQIPAVYIDEKTVMFQVEDTAEADSSVLLATFNSSFYS